MSIKVQLLEDFINATSGIDGISQILNKMMLQSVKDGTSDDFIEKLESVITDLKDKQYKMKYELKNTQFIQNIRRLVKIEENETKCYDFVRGAKYVDIYIRDYEMVVYLMEIIGHTSDGRISIKYLDHPIEEYNEAERDINDARAGESYFQNSKCYRVIE